jgi:ABC-type bacteriocin/lantibiotic exporter with double-glycine peptidase domain
MADTISQVLSIIQIIVGIVVAATFYFTIRTFRQANNAEQIKLADNFQQAILEYEQETAELKRNNTFEQERKYWEYRLFNRIEWYSFLVNKKHIRDRDIIEFFHGYITSVYDKILNLPLYESDKNNPKRLPEFKALYERLKAIDKGREK